MPYFFIIKKIILFVHLTFLNFIHKFLSHYYALILLLYACHILYCTTLIYTCVLLGTQVKFHMIPNECSNGSWHWGCWLFIDIGRNKYNRSARLFDLLSTFFSIAKKIDWWTYILLPHYTYKVAKVFELCFSPLQYLNRVE